MCSATDGTASDSVLVMNRSSYTDVELTHFLDHDCETAADATAVVVPADGRSDYACVVLDGGRQVESFD